MGDHSTDSGMAQVFVCVLLSGHGAAGDKSNGASERLGTTCWPFPVF